MKMKSILQGTTLLITLGASASASAFVADDITFDPDGTLAANGDSLIRNLDWFPGSTLVEGFGGGITTITDGQTVTGEVQTYSHEALATMGVVTNPGTVLEEVNANAPNGLNTNMEITFISAFKESVSTTFNIVDTGADVNTHNILAVNTASTFTFLAGGDNFFEVYFDDLTNATDLKSNGLTGLGYDDGTQILAGTIDNISGGNFNVTYAAGTNPGLFQFEDVNGDGDFDPLVDVIVAVSYALLDSSGDDQWSVANVLQYLSVTGTGGTTIFVDVATTDGTFFKDDITQLVQDTEFTTENKVPFVQVNPSLCYDSATGKITNSDQTLVGNDAGVAAQLAAAGCTTPTYDLGGNLAGGTVAVNGLEGPDLLLQSDASQSFKKTVAVPEPGILALLGLGLGMLGARSLRSRQGRLSA